MEKVKRITATVFIIVAAGIALSVGLWAITLVFNSVQIPTMGYGVTNESINFATNNTYYTFVQTGILECLLLTNIPANCGVTSVSMFANTTTTLPAARYNFTSSQIKIFTNNTISTGTYNVSYSFYDIQSAQSYNTLTTVQTNIFNALLLLSVGLIVMGAAMIISYFYVGGKRGGY
jgi:hypothetical protein